MIVISVLLIYLLIYLLLARWISPRNAMERLLQVVVCRRDNSTMAKRE